MVVIQSEFRDLRLEEMLVSSSRFVGANIPSSQAIWLQVGMPKIIVYITRVTRCRIQMLSRLRQHGTSHFICISVFALTVRKKRDTKEEKVPLCRRLDRRLRKSCISQHLSALDRERQVQETRRARIAEMLSLL
jgi:hypothetical protein